MDKNKHSGVEFKFPPKEGVVRYEELKEGQKYCLFNSLTITGNTSTIYIEPETPFEIIFPTTNPRLLELLPSGQLSDILIFGGVVVVIEKEELRKHTIIKVD